jgi:hypothetical protein
MRPCTQSLVPGRKRERERERESRGREREGGRKERERPNTQLIYGHKCKNNKILPS